MFHTIHRLCWCLCDVAGVVPKALLSPLGSEEVSSRRRRMQVEGTVCSTNMYFYVSSGVHVRALIRVLIEGFVTELYGASGDRKENEKKSGVRIDVGDPWTCTSIGRTLERGGGYAPRRKSLSGIGSRKCPGFFLPSSQQCVGV